jgi:hypothetical protein
MNLEIKLKEENAPPTGNLYPVLPVLWVFLDYERRWTVRMEGEDSEWRHTSRRDALIAARLIGESYGCYRLHCQLDDGRFCLEMMNLGRRCS